MTKSVKRRYWFTTCPMIMRKNWRKYVATISHGEAKLLQEYTSDVSLEIPAGNEGIFMMRVHTDHGRFMQVVRDDECLIGPLTELEYITFSGEPANCPHIISFPHSKRDKNSWKCVKVRNQT